MKTVFRVYILVMMGWLAVFMAGCDAETVDFIAATPPNDSTIQPDATITVIFDGTPDGIAVYPDPGTVTTDGQTVTISGPFPAGPLGLIITWDDNNLCTLNYTVTKPQENPPTTMVSIPAGEFQMGNADPEANKDEQPVHAVSVNAFYMDEYAVTNTQYKKFVEAKPEWQKDHIGRGFHNGNYLKDWNGIDYPAGKSNHPVRYVSWYGAMAYASWVGKRLPTEAEWEYAARGGLSGKKYPWGDGIDSGKANYGGNVGDTTAVGKYPPNRYGLYDMAGNVSEWCLDEYNKDFYASSPRENPLSGANTVEWVIKNFTGIKTDRVLRGGSWRDSPEDVQAANRNGNAPTGTGDLYGFRCARTR